LLRGAYIDLGFVNGIDNPVGLGYIIDYLLDKIGSITGQDVYVASGAVNNTDIVLTLTNGNTVTVSNVLSVDDDWYQGAGDPTTNPPVTAEPVKAGDKYLDVNTGIIYQYDGATWTVFYNIGLNDKHIRYHSDPSVVAGAAPTSPDGRIIFGTDCVWFRDYQGQTGLIYKEETHRLTYFISPKGDDAIAQRGKPHFPFSHPLAAIKHLQAEIDAGNYPHQEAFFYVHPGVYSFGGALSGNVGLQYSEVSDYPTSDNSLSLCTRNHIGSPIHLNWDFAEGATVVLLPIAGTQLSVFQSDGSNSVTLRGGNFLCFSNDAPTTVLANFVNTEMDTTDGIEKWDLKPNRIFWAGNYLIKMPDGSHQNSILEFKFDCKNPIRLTQQSGYDFGQFFNGYLGDISGNYGFKSFSLLAEVVYEPGSSHTYAYRSRIVGGNGINLNLSLKGGFGYYISDMPYSDIIVSEDETYSGGDPNSLNGFVYEGNFENTLVKHSIKNAEVAGTHIELFKLTNKQQHFYFNVENVRWVKFIDSVLEPVFLLNTTDHSEVKVVIEGGTIFTQSFNAGGINNNQGVVRIVKHSDTHYPILVKNLTWIADDNVIALKDVLGNQSGFVTSQDNGGTADVVVTLTQCKAPTGNGYGVQPVGEALSVIPELTDFAHYF